MLQTENNFELSQPKDSSLAAVYLWPPVQTLPQGSPDLLGLGISKDVYIQALDKNIKQFSVPTTSQKITVKNPHKMTRSIKTSSIHNQVTVKGQSSCTCFALEHQSRIGCSALGFRCALVHSFKLIKRGQFMSIIRTSELAFLELNQAEISLA